MLDYNEWWIRNYFKEDEICYTTWKDNKHLTKLQQKYFENLKILGGSPDANAVNRRNYLIYYEGVYSELKGSIFNSDNIHFGKLPNGNLFGVQVFCDPSALRGADYFAGVLSARCSTDGNVWVIDTFSVNGGEGETRESVCKRIRGWCAEWDVKQVYIETNGLCGLEFYDFAFNSGLPVAPWDSKGNKFERIVSAYGNITERMVLSDTENNREYCKQVYLFGKKCEHDDNIDALVSTYNMQRYLS